MTETAGISGITTDSRMEKFMYPCEPDPSLPWREWIEEQEPEEASCTEPSEDMLQRLQEESQRAFAAGRQQGIEEGRKLERAERSAEDAEHGARLQSALDAFAAAREQTVQDFEPAVVRLALAIAARILRREAHTDPLLLSGAVRVALGQLASSAHVRLRVPAAEQKLWAEWIAMLPSTKAGLVVEAAEGMRLGECVIESDLGSADLGVRAQLGEIDRTFFEACTEAGTV